MDYRNRKYYLISLSDSMLSWWENGHDDYGVRYDYYLKRIREKMYSVKFGKPYNHFLHIHGKWGDDPVIDGVKPQLFISVDRNEGTKFEDLMYEFMDKDINVRCIELTKEICGQ